MVPALSCGTRERWPGAATRRGLEAFNEMFMQVAAAFANVAVRRHGRSYVLGRPGGPPPCYR